MIRFIFRALALLSLAVAVIFAVLDATRSIAASQLVTTPFATSWAAGLPEALAQTQATAEQYNAWDPGLLNVLQLPGFVIFAALAFLLYMIGRKPAGRRRFAAER